MTSDPVLLRDFFGKVFPRQEQVDDGNGTQPRTVTAAMQEAVAVDVQVCHPELLQRCALSPLWAICWQVATPAPSCECRAFSGRSSARSGHMAIATVQITGRGGLEQRLNLYTGPLVEKRTVPAGSWKPCNYLQRGHWQAQGRKCEAWQLVSRICMQIQYDAAAQLWGLGELYGKGGCDFRRHYMPITKQRLPVPSWRSPKPPVITAAQVRTWAAVAIMTTLRLHQRDDLCMRRPF